MGDQSFLDAALKKIDYTFRWIGINIESSKKTKIQNLRYKFVFIFNVIWLNMDLSGAIAWLIINLMKGTSFTMLTYVAPCITISFLENFKIMSLAMCDRLVNELLAVLRKLESQHHDVTNPAKAALIKNDLEFLFLVLKVLNSVNWFGIIAFPLMPVCLTAFEYYYTRKLVLKLPFLIVYPFDAYDIKYWPYAYLRQIWATVIVIVGISATDFLFYICVSCICVQFKLLEHEITHMISGRSVLQTSELQHRKIRYLVRWHLELMHAVHLLELIFSKAMLFNFTLSSLLICLCGFNIMTIDDKPYMLSFASFLFSCLFQILSLCYFGDMLMKASIRVGDGIFNSKWYTAQSNIIKELFIIQIRAQKPCKVTAHGYTDVNLTAFSKILSTSWSYFALLRTVYNSPRV